MQALMTKPYAHQIVICPHVYGPAVTHSSQGATGQGLFQRLSASFGHLTQQGLQGPQGQVRPTRNIISVSFFLLFLVYLSDYWWAQFANEVHRIMMPG